jgi:putative glycosyltransferase (TIGR04372 family)
VGWRAGIASMIEDRETLHYLRPSDPADMRRVFSQQNLQHLANAVSPHLVAGAKTLVYVLSMPSRIGHLALEPHALFNLYGDEYDQLVVVTRQNPTFPASRGLTELAGPYLRFADTLHPEVVEMGHHDGNVQDFGIFSFAIASPQVLLARFVEKLASGFTPKYFTIPNEMRARGGGVLARLGISENDKVVAFHARTAGTHAAAAYHDYRNARLESFEPLLRYLLDEGYWVIRLGDKASPGMPIAHARLVDLPKLPDYQDFLDVVVADRSEFGVMCDSGPEAIFRILGKPILRANCAATHHVWLGRDDLLLLKNYRDLKENRLLGYREILDRGLSCVVATRDLEKHQVEIMENTPDELLAAGIEMVGRMAGRGPDDSPSQDRFRAIGLDFQNHFKTLPPEERLPGATLVTCYGYGLPWVKHAQSYFDTHPRFLD